MPLLSWKRLYQLRDITFNLETHLELQKRQNMLETKIRFHIYYYAFKTSKWKKYVLAG